MGKVAELAVEEREAALASLPGWTLRADGKAVLTRLAQALGTTYTALSYKLELCGPDAHERQAELYALPDDLPVSVELGEDDRGLLAVEAAFPYRGRSARLRRHPLWPYRYWVVGYALLIALFLVFSLR